MKNIRLKSTAENDRNILDFTQQDFGLNIDWLRGPGVLTMEKSKIVNPKSEGPLNLFMGTIQNHKSKIQNCLT